MSGRHRIFRWNRLRTAYALAFTLVLALTELGREVYPPVVYRTGFNDWGFADTLGNHLGALTLVFFIPAVMNANRAEALIVIVTVTGGYVLYELGQSFLPGSVSDAGDMTACMIGGVLSLLLFMLIHSFVSGARRFAGRTD